MEYVIFMDVSGDIDKDFAKENDVKFVPMDYSIGGEMRKCTEMESDEILKVFYDGQRNGDLTKTTQITPYMYEETFAPYMAEGKSVIYICLSEGLSSTFASANMAKASLEDEYPDAKLYPVNSLAATGGMGLMTERAVRNQKKGMTAEENYSDLVDLSKKMRHWFMVQDLMYLKRGGRVSRATAVVGTMMNIRPVLEIDRSGKLPTIAKKRGNKEAAKYMMERFHEDYDTSCAEDPIYVIDGDCADIADDLAEKIKAEYPDVTVRRMGLSPIIGAHTGPGMVAIIHVGGERFLDGQE